MSDMESIRLHLDGKWSARELASLMKSLEDIYNFAFILETPRLPTHLREKTFPPDRRRIRIIASRLDNFNKLSIRRIDYASPGLADITGFAKAIGHVKSLVLGIVDRAIETRERRLKNEAREIANHNARIANATAIENLKQLKREGKAKTVHSANVRMLKTERMSLRNGLLEEDLRDKKLANDEKEITVFSKDLTTMMRKKRLTPSEQKQTIKWLGSRMLILADLVDAGKVSGVTELFVSGEPRTEK